MLLICISVLAAISAHPLSSGEMRAAVSNLVREIDSTHLTTKPSLKIIEGLEDNTVSTGESVTLRCDVLSTPTGVIYWEKDGQRIQGDKELNVFEKVLNAMGPTVESGIITSSYQIPCANLHHIGSYKCVATNGHDTVESSAKISVEGQTVKCKSTRRSAPVITMSTESRFELQDNAATLICRADRRANWNWMFEDKKIDFDSGRYELLPSGDLLIRKIQWSDMGSYFCIAHNKYGESRGETFLYPTKNILLNLFCWYP